MAIGAVPAPPGTQALTLFWRRWLPAGLPARLVSAVLDQAVPKPPDDPTPAQVLDFARLHDSLRGLRPDLPKSQPAVHRPGDGHRPAVLYDGLLEAFALVAPEIRAGRPPHAGEALDCFVAAHAGARGVRDTPAFRRALTTEIAAEPRIDHYWRLVARLSTPDAASPDPSSPGAADTWLRTALSG
ncbi:hypothetical protein ACFO3J_33475 [Streptomyces polygonati]|uniref:Uncharacterized protein n=1 Tax=Streptomyces polygonati TaxID=1617087 RepID=A0ABV8HW73_9ACTN